MPTHTKNIMLIPSILLPLSMFLPSEAKPPVPNGIWGFVYLVSFGQSKTERR